MSTEMSPRIRTLVSGLSAVAITGLLMSTLVESLNPAALSKRSVESETPVAAATVDHGSVAAPKRRA
ncbi:MAG: hypothetical protein WBO00_01650 [Steroidobacteraceae bacterium]